MKVIKKSKKVIAEVAKVLERGRVVIFPTDTVYGFLADAKNKKAVDKIYKIKKRPRSKPLPIFVKDLKIAKELAEISREQEKVIKKFWPGKYTFILKSKIKNQKSKLYGVAKDSIAIRIPKHKFLHDLLKKINKPLVQTSVNISGEKSLTKISDIQKEFKKEKGIGLIIDGGSIKKSKPSKIIDLSKGKAKILRK